MNEWQYLPRDLKHFAVNANILLGGLLFYVKFGFYGWAHLITVLCIQYAVLPLDDWLEGKRSFPFHAGVLMAIAFYFYPLITVLAFFGDVIVNLQALLKKENFWLERIEGLGNVLIYIVPFALPIGERVFSIYLAAALFLIFADSFHKIGHRETKPPQSMWLTGLVSCVLVAILFIKPSVDFLILSGVMLGSLVPFATLKQKKHSWLYTQFWFGFAGFIAHYYYLFVFLP